MERNPCSNRFVHSCSSLSCYILHTRCTHAGLVSYEYSIIAKYKDIALPWSPSLCSALNPPGCSSSPTILSGSERSLSTTVTLRPSLASTAPTADPRIPAPTTTISVSQSNVTGAAMMFCGLCGMGEKACSITYVHWINIASDCHRLMKQSV